MKRLLAALMLAAFLAGCARSYSHDSSRVKPIYSLGCSGCGGLR